MNKQRHYLNMDRENKSIYLTEEVRENDISPEDAYTLLMYYEYKAEKGKEELIWDIIHDVEGYEPITDYGYCSVISEDYYEDVGIDRCFDEIKKKRLNKGAPDYILLRRKGRLNLIHLSTDFETLKNRPYRPSQERLGDGGGSFSIGLYVLDLTHNGHLEGKPGWHTGVYEGYYYECIADLQNGKKCGGEKLSQKEFFIPRNVDNILWS